MPTRALDLARDRLPGWVAGFVERHGPVRWTHEAPAVVLRGADGAVARLLALDPAGAERVAARAGLDGWPTQPRLALVLVRRGRFAVGLADHETLVAHRSGTRYVQSRTAAGGWSQQRYQRRRDNQAAALVRHVADTAVDLCTRLGAHEGSGRAFRPEAVVLGGDRHLAEEVLADPRLAPWRDLPRREAYDLPSPTTAVLRETLARARGVRVLLSEPDGGTVGTMTDHAPTARELLPAAVDNLTHLVEQLPQDAWDRATPCEGWTVRDVLNHVTGEHLWAPRLLGGETIEQVGDAYEGDVLGEAPLEAWRSASGRSVQAWSEASDESRTVALSFGDCPVGEYARQMLLDLTVHTWDVARGAGLDAPRVPEAVDTALGFMTANASPSGVEGIFAAPVSTSSSDRLDQLVALTGRDPAWRG